MELKSNKNTDIKLKIGISGASGFGKTYSALLVGYGITNDWSKIAVIDTEGMSSSYYSFMGDFKILDLRAPYTPERFIKSIEVCEKEKIEVIIVDSVSSEWNGSGGCLEIHEQLGNRFQNWMSVKKRHQKFIDKMLQSKCHIITTIRRKTDYVLEKDINGKIKVVKHGTKPIISNGFEYELTVNFELMNDKHEVNISKNRLGIFKDNSRFVITKNTGKRLINYVKTLKTNKQEIEKRINDCLSVSQLMSLYKDHPNFQQPLKDVFQAKKQQLEQLISHQYSSKNGAQLNGS